MGRAWYEDGKVLKKKNSFTDFIACAEHLIQQGYTSKEKLAIYGVSAGGVLVASCLVEGPPPFQAMGAQIPFLDGITFLSETATPLCAHTHHEWGNAVR